MIFIFLSFFISSIYFLIVGSISSRVLFNENINEKNNYYEFALFGIIVSSILAFLINFFVSLNRYINDLLFILPFIVLLFNSHLKINLEFKELFKLSLIVAIISTVVISYDNVYRPDAGSYHLPFISILNDNKIIIGLSNLHFRFGHISIMQYLSASFNNHIFFDKGILIPGGIIFTFMTLYLLTNIYNQKNNFIVLISFIFLIFIFFRMNRYSSLGNDGPAHFYFMYLMILTLNYKEYIQNYNNFFNKISLIGIFIFFNKLTMLLALLIPLFFIFQNNFLKIYKSKIFLCIILIFFSWIGKNIITSGCAAFPLEQTCFKKLQWFDKSETRRSNAKSGRIENEAWTKGAPNQTEKSFEEFIQTFEWINTWKKHHGKKIIKKITPFLIFVSIFTLFIVMTGKNKKFTIFNKKEKIFWFLIFLNLFGSILWFIKFPVFRYGYGYLISFFGILYVFILLKVYEINFSNFRKKLKLIFIIFFIGLLSKHSLRIYQNFDLETTPWPVIYSDNPLIVQNKMTPHFQNNEIIFYTPQLSMCYYSNLSPCTNMAKNEFDVKDIKMEKVKSYKKYYFVK
ncbi:hypothetical protein IDH14_03660 [Pelagibacterales bacterium SAG-MED33]|nr:hypothetical protein [Pelagibacterales bacterium SAG-MED33]